MRISSTYWRDRMKGHAKIVPIVKRSAEGVEVPLHISIHQESFSGEHSSLRRAMNQKSKSVLSPCPRFHLYNSARLLVNNIYRNRVDLYILIRKVSRHLNLLRTYTDLSFSNQHIQGLLLPPHLSTTTYLWYSSYSRLSIFERCSSSSFLNRDC